MAAKLTLATEIAYQCDGDTGECSLEDFFDANEMDEAERADVFNAMTADGLYFGGSGAAPEYTLALASEFYS